MKEEDFFRGTGLVYPQLLKKTLITKQYRPPGSPRALNCTLNSEGKSQRGAITLKLLQQQVYIP